MAASDELLRGREAYESRAWRSAFESLSRADQAASLEGSDLELLATAAYMLGREDEYLHVLERAHKAYLAEGKGLPAVRSAFWVGVNLARQGELGPATGWLGRAQRLVEREGRNCVERGYLLLPVMFEHEAARDWEAASAAAAEAIEIAEQFGDQDLFALAAHEQGHILIRDEQIETGLALLDEAMVAASAGELSPIVTGIVYCGVILACQDAYEIRRAREWTAVLSSWCEQQPELVAFTGRCLVHRAEIMQIQGAWAEALSEARRAGERSTEAMNDEAAGDAAYRQGELHRLRGEFADAEDAYRESSRHGRQPQPGLSLLRLAQGRKAAAGAAIRRAAVEAGDGPARGILLTAQVEIMLALGELEEARDACRMLERLGSGHQGGMLDALLACSRGAVKLEGGEPGAALAALRHAFQVWQELEAPYELARTRVLIGRACRALGDEDAAALELEAARSTFEQLRAAPDLAAVDSLARGAAPDNAHGLTPRELEVLRLVAAGERNRAIAAELVVSERTVDRHVSNIFTKLGVSTRTAATAYAYEHELI